jgi:hypothetical protein
VTKQGHSFFHFEPSDRPTSRNFCAAAAELVNVQQAIADGRPSPLPDGKTEVFHWHPTIPSFCLRQYASAARRALAFRVGKATVYALAKRANEDWSEAAMSAALSKESLSIAADDYDESLSSVKRAAPVMIAIRQHPVSPRYSGGPESAARSSISYRPRQPCSGATASSSSLRSPY